MGLAKDIRKIAEKRKKEVDIEKKAAETLKYAETRARALPIANEIISKLPELITEKAEQGLFALEIPYRSQLSYSVTEEENTVFQLVITWALENGFKANIQRKPEFHWLSYSLDGPEPYKTVIISWFD